MQISISYSNTYAFLDALEQKFGVEVMEDCSERKIPLSSKLGSGNIYAYSFADGIGLFVLDIDPKEPLTISLEQESVASMIFCYCEKGNIKVGIEESLRSKQFNLAELSSIIIAKSEAQSLNFFWPKGQRHVTVLLTLTKKEYLNSVKCDIDTLPDLLQESISDLEAEKSFIYQSRFNPSIARVINDLKSCDLSGLLKSTYIEGKALELLTYQIESYQNDISLSSEELNISEYDQQRLIEAKNHLLKDLRSPPTIPELAHHVGINQQKLKQGFKKLFKTTIGRYLRGKQLEKGQMLLMDNETSIKQVAHSVGYKNQSHFARRFKEKYGMLPKDFRKQITSRPIKALESEEE